MIKGQNNTTFNLVKKWLPYINFICQHFRGMITKKRQEENCLHRVRKEQLGGTGETFLS